MATFELFNFLLLDTVHHGCMLLQFLVVVSHEVAVAAVKQNLLLLLAILGVLTQPGVVAETSLTP